MKTELLIAVLLAGVATVEGHTNDVAVYPPFTTQKSQFYDITVFSMSGTPVIRVKCSDVAATNIDITNYKGPVQIGTNYYTVKEIERNAKLWNDAKLFDHVTVQPVETETFIYHAGFRVETNTWYNWTNTPPTIKWQLDDVRAWRKTNSSFYKDVLEVELGYRSDGTVVWRTPPEAKK